MPRKRAQGLSGKRAGGPAGHDASRDLIAERVGRGAANHGFEYRKETALWRGVDIPHSFRSNSLIRTNDAINGHDLGAIANRHILGLPLW